MVLCKGHVEGNKAVGSADELVKLITISVYYDKDEYHISDNTKTELIDAGLLPDDYDGEVITTTDWNALNKDSEGNDVIAYSFKIQVTAVEGRVVSQDSLEYALVNSLNLTAPDSDGTKYVMTPTGYEASLEEAGEEDAVTLANYVTYSGKLWRMVSLNNDGTVKLVTSNGISQQLWSDIGSTDYSTSTIRNYLINEVLPTLNDDLIVDTVWDYTTYETFPTSKLQVTDSKNEKIGLVSIYDYMMTGGRETSGYGIHSFLNNSYGWWTLTPVNDASVWMIITIGDAMRWSSASGHRDYAYVRPSVVLKANIKVTGGTGAYGDPYKLEGDI